MRPTDLIQLATNICTCKDGRERQRLYSRCPAHLSDLLKTNVAFLQSARQRAAAKARAKHAVARKRAIAQYEQRKLRSDQYRNSPSHPSQRQKVKKLIPSAALKQCDNIRAMLAGASS